MHGIKHRLRDLQAAESEVQILCYSLPLLAWHAAGVSAPLHRSYSGSLILLMRTPCSEHPVISRELFQVAVCTLLLFVASLLSSEILFENI